MQNYNKLSPAQTERLSLLLEECAEVIQIAGKILRHGYEEYHPNDPDTSNRQLLEKEIGDVLMAIQFLEKNSDVDQIAVTKRTADKMTRVGKYLHHNAV